MKTSVLLIAGVTAVWIAGATVSSAATLRAGFQETVIAAGLSNPTAMALAPDGRVFVTQQGGAVRVVKDGALLAAPFLTLTVNAAGERGLLGIALDPQFVVNGFVYVYYTATAPTIHNRVSRFTANGDTAVPGSETVLLDLPTLGATNHNGGAIHFGPDGLLYIAVGENAVGANAQSLSSPLGKMLRINRDGTIPGGNPFAGQAGAHQAIWALGLRNPFTLAFEAGTGRMLINDVGQDAWEEINEGIAGANYGWPATEGATTNPQFTSPIYAYPHSTPGVCAITGGAFYPLLSPQFPDDYAGDYFFADFCGGWIGHYDSAGGTASLDFATGIGSPVDLTLAPGGGLFYLARGSGTLVRIDYASDTPPIIAHGPASQTAVAGRAVTFSVGASGALPLSYQWFRGDAVIAGATGPSYTLPAVTPADDGAQFRVRVSNALGEVTSGTATLTVLRTALRPRTPSARGAPTGRVARPRR